MSHDSPYFFPFFILGTVKPLILETMIKCILLKGLLAYQTATTVSCHFFFMTGQKGSVSTEYIYSPLVVVLPPGLELSLKCLHPMH